MLQPTFQTTAEPVWRAAQDWPATDRPVALWPWLTITGSLTERLRQHYGSAFALQLLAEQSCEFTVADVALLQDKPRGLCREVTLNAGIKPLVYARTLLPDEALAAQPGLQTLGNTPLGDAVFNGTRSATRPVLEIANLSAVHAFYQATATHVPNLPATLWARRSVLQIAGQRVLIYEAFLPALMEGSHGV